MKYAYGMNNSIWQQFPCSVDSLRKAKKEALATGATHILTMSTGRVTKVR